nr:MAK10-like protein [Tanacetum cinerariifolium]
MRDENPIRTLEDYSKPNHEGYGNTIELPVGNNVVPFRSDTIRFVQNGCSFHGLRSEDRNQHLKDFLKLVDSLDLDGDNKERTLLGLFQFSLHDQASNWLERLPAGSITTWEDLTTRFLAQFFPAVRTTKLRIDILMFQKHHGDFVTRLTIDQSAGGKLRDRNAIESWALLEDLTLYDNESWNDPRDFAKPVKAITLPQDVPSTSDRRLIELENQVQRLMEAHLALKKPTQVNKVTTSCEICNGPHDTQYYVTDPKQAFVEYASLRTDEAKEKTDHIFGLADGTKSYPVGIVKDLEVHIEKLKLFNDFYVIDMKKDPKTPLLVRRGFLATDNAVIDCRMVKIAIGEEITRSVYGVKGVDLGEEEVPYWTTHGKGESYKPQPRSEEVGAQTPYYARKDFFDCHLPREWEIARDAELNPFKDTLVLEEWWST